MPIAIAWKMYAPKPLNIGMNTIDTNAIERMTRIMRSKAVAAGARLYRSRRPTIPYRTNGNQNHQPSAFVMFQRC